MMSMDHYPRILRPPRGSFFLFGLRGIGKTTWVGDRYPKATRIDLLDESLYQALLADPGLFASRLQAVPPQTLVVVDEIQRIPSLLNEVHRFVETRKLRFALLGSSARKLKTAGTNLLAGRAVWKTMFPLVPEELGGDFDLAAILQYGSIPVIWNAPERQPALEAYVRLYVKEEVQAEALVRNLPGFTRFLPVAALFHGQVMNVSGVARDAGAARTTVSGYLDILEDTLLAWRLPAYETRLRVRERKHPKLFWTDSGVVRAAKKQLGPVTAEEKGHLLEGWVLSMLRAYAEERGLCEEIHYWSPAGTQIEVDFLMRRGRDFLALEVKAGKRFSSTMLTGLKAIAEFPRLARRLLVYGGEETLKTPDGIEVWPVSRLLQALESDALWP